MNLPLKHKVESWKKKKKKKADMLYFMELIPS